MRCKFVKDATVDDAQYKKGDIADIRDDAAQKLISRGYAKVWNGKGDKDAAASGE